MPKDTKLSFAFAVVSLAIAAQVARAQVTANVISRVYQIRVGNETATSVILDDANGQYLVTANHVVEKSGTDAKIEILSEGNWLPLDVTILHGNTNCDDVAVLIPKQAEPILNSAPLEQISNFFMGQEVYFLGYPYGLSMKATQVHLSAALIKHAYVSAVVRCSDLTAGTPEDKNVLLLDGFNNPGFSGGPVVTRDPNDAEHPFKIIGIISAYRAENTPVSVNGQAAVGASVQTNTGIVVAIGIDQASALIKAYKAKNKTAQ